MNRNHTFAPGRLRRALPILLLAALFCVWTVSAAAAILPTPTKAAQAAALGRLQESLKTKYLAATTAEKQRGLAEELLQTAVKSGDPVAQYVALREAQELALRASRADLALKAIRELEARFEVPGLDLQAAALINLSRTRLSPAESRVLSADALTVIEEAITKDRYDLAGPLGQAAVAAALGATDAALAKQSAAAAAEVQEFSRLYDAAKQALVILDKDPIDPAANLAVGKYRCLVRGQWREGLAMLALGSDGTLRNLAIQELRGTANAAQRAALAESWRQLAERETGRVQRNLRARADAVSRGAQSLDRRAPADRSAARPVLDAADAPKGASLALTRLKAVAQARIRLDNQRFTAEQLREIEDLYQVANNRRWDAPEAKQSLDRLVQKYPHANRTGCAVLYLGQMSGGTAQIGYLEQAVSRYSDCCYGNGVQVGAYARYCLGMVYHKAGAADKAKALFDELRKKYPDSVDHDGQSLASLIP